MKILVMGLSGAGKTTLAQQLTKRIQGVHLNADRVRETLSSDLGFSTADRLEQARRMGWMAQFIKESGIYAVADFICPTPEARLLFGADFTIWMDTVQMSAHRDTDLIFVPPVGAYRISEWDYSIEEIVAKLPPL